MSEQLLMSALGWEQPVTPRRPHRDTSARADAHQRSFTRAGDRPCAYIMNAGFDSSERTSLRPIRGPGSRTASRRAVRAAVG